MAKSGSFITASSFKGIEQAQQTGGHTLSHGVVYGIVTEDNPLHIRTANCPYISEVSGDTVSLVGKCAWTDGEDDIFTDWNTTFFRAARELLMAHKLSLEVRASSAFKAVIPSSVRLECSHEHCRAESRFRGPFGPREAKCDQFFSSTLWGGDRQPAGTPRFSGSWAGDRLICEGFDPGSE